MNVQLINISQRLSRCEDTSVSIGSAFGLLLDAPAPSVGALWCVSGPYQVFSVMVM